MAEMRIETQLEMYLTCNAVPKSVQSYRDTPGGCGRATRARLTRSIDDDDNDNVGALLRIHPHTGYHCLGILNPMHTLLRAPVSPPSCCAHGSPGHRRQSLCDIGGPDRTSTSTKAGTRECEVVGWWMQAFLFSSCLHPALGLWYDGVRSGQAQAAIDDFVSGARHRTRSVLVAAEQLPSRPPQHQ